MKTKYLSAVLSLGALLLSLNVAKAQQRALLFSQTPSASLQEVVDKLRDPSTAQIDPEPLTRESRYFVRIAPRQFILSPTGWLNDSAIPNQGDAMLGGHPFVFLTSPKSLYGRSLLEIFENIGYEAENILHSQLNQDMVAIVFRYRDDVVPAPEITDGHLPSDWNNRVYVPYWDNAFALFHRLAPDATVKNGAKIPFDPYHLSFATDAEKAFALGDSPERNLRFKNSSYMALQVRGGDDWHYRQLMEDQLGLFEHFRGDGHTHNEVSDQIGVFEFVGPTRKLKELPEVAIIDLGRLTVTDGYQNTAAKAETP